MRHLSRRATLALGAKIGASSAALTIVGWSGDASFCDLNQDGVIDILDVQLGISQALGIVPCTTANLDSSGTCTV